MKSSKKLYSSCFPEYVLDDIQLKKLQDTLFDMLVDICNVFNRYGIKYMLSGGTLLGAIRHKGFIPWDDDVDIMMTREEYEKFKTHVSELNSQYSLVEPNTDDYYCKNPKLFKKNTLYVEMSNAGLKKYNMVFLDIFIIENMPAMKLKRKIIGSIYDICYKGSSVCVDYLYPSQPILEKAKSNNELAKYYQTRRNLGRIFSHIGGIKFYLKLINKLAVREKKTGYYGVPSAISYNREVFENSMFDDLIEVEFCGRRFKAPAAYDQYLNNLYGNYMQIPPIDKRETHVAYKIQL